MTAEGPVVADPTPGDLPSALEDYLDAAARVIARPEEVGRFTLFRPTDPGPHFARPRPRAGVVTTEDLQRLAARFAALGAGVAVDWLESVSPELEALCREQGLRTSVHPVLTTGTHDVGRHLDAGAATDHELVVLDAGSPLLPAALAVVAVAFGTPPGQGLDVAGDPGRGVADRRLLEPTYPPQRLRLLSDRIAAGQAVLTVALVEGEVVGVCHYRPVGGAAEVVGLATLPDFRRRGLASALTRAHVQHAAEHGVDLMLLTAKSEDVERLSTGLGFVLSDRAGQAVD